VPPSIRKLPAPASPQDALPPAPPSLLVVPPAPPLPPERRAVDRPVVAPLAPERYRVQFTIGKQTQEKLRRLQELMRREIPDGDPATIFDRGLTLLLADVERKKLAATPKPRPPRAATPGSRTIPAHVRRAVARRDRGECAFVAKDARRCGERSFLEFHHVRPYAQGGAATVENIALRCRAHNAYEAEVVFGRRVARGANSVWTELTGGLPDFARTPL
jgi:HNH endonuclease